jgi:hypothetical protein
MHLQSELGSCHGSPIVKDWLVFVTTSRTQPTCGIDGFHQFEARVENGYPGACPNQDERNFPTVFSQHKNIPRTKPSGSNNNWAEA